MNIAKIMTPKYSTACLLETSTVRQGLELMRSRGYTAIPVLNKDGRYLGSVTEGDFLRHMMQAGTTELKEHEKYRVGAIFRPDFCPALDIQASETDVIDAVPSAELRHPSWMTGAVCAALSPAAPSSSIWPKRTAGSAQKQR